MRRIRTADWVPSLPKRVVWSHSSLLRALSALKGPCDIGRRVQTALLSYGSDELLEMGPRRLFKGC